MEIADPQTTQQIASAKELEAFLSRRVEKQGTLVNSFQLGHGERFPTLTIWIRGELASLWYCPSEDHAGFISIGTATSLKKGGTTGFDFYGEELQRPNESVITAEEAVCVAQEFLESPRLPKSIAWLEL